MLRMMDRELRPFVDQFRHGWPTDITFGDVRNAVTQCTASGAEVRNIEMPPTPLPRDPATLAWLRRRLPRHERARDGGCRPPEHVHTRAGGARRRGLHERGPRRRCGMSPHGRAAMLRMMDRELRPFVDQFRHVRAEHFPADAQLHGP